MPEATSASQRLKIAIAGTYLPQRCGIATFASDLLTSLAGVAPGGSISAIALKPPASSFDYPAEVLFEIDQDDLSDYSGAVEFVNLNGFDVVSLQHEFGIYGGNAGGHVLRLLRGLRVPVVTTLHTVLADPTGEQRAVIQALAESSARVVVMSKQARRFLVRDYGVHPSRVAVIPHGVPAMPFLDTSYHKDKFDLIGRKVILAFGLLSRGKGIEQVVAALPEIVAAHPDVLFVVAGETHPTLKRSEGEAYRRSLAAQAEALGVADHIRFIDGFLDSKSLTDIISTADICVTPYLSREQIVSGVLSYALGAGKAIVSTPYWYAEEVLANGRGRLTPFGDSLALAGEMNDLLSNEAARQMMRKRAYTFARDMVWPSVAARYLKLFAEVRDEASARRRTARPPVSVNVPVLSLDHLRILTDGTGLLQHACFSVPDRNHGYCTDDNARALIVALLARRMTGDESEVMHLATRYLSFLHHAFNSEAGRFRNFMSYDRLWAEQVGSEDAHGRALWALGIAVAEPTRLRGLAMTLFERALPAVDEVTSLRAQCFALVGIDAFLRHFSGATEVKRARSRLASALSERFQACRDGDWPWPEDMLSYANAIVPHALIASGARMADDEMVETGIKALRWLVKIQTSPAGHFAPIGNGGWFRRGARPARFDQQPIEAQHMIDALVEAFRITGDQAWLTQARHCFGWFLGQNDLEESLCDVARGACKDGLSPHGMNQNEGAESTLAYLHALVVMSIHSRLVFPTSLADLAAPREPISIPLREAPAIVSQVAQ